MPPRVFFRPERWWLELTVCTVIWMLNADAGASTLPATAVAGVAPVGGAEDLGTAGLMTTGFFTRRRFASR